MIAKQLKEITGDSVEIAVCIITIFGKELRNLKNKPQVDDGHKDRWLEKHCIRRHCIYRMLWDGMSHKEVGKGANMNSGQVQQIDAKTTRALTKYILDNIELTPIMRKQIEVERDK